MPMTPQNPLAQLSLRDRRARLARQFWADGKNTAEIAKLLGLTEAELCNEYEYRLGLKSGSA